MRRLEIPGGWFGDARVVDQAYAVQRSGQKVVATHAGDLSAPDDFLFVRIPYVGPFKIAAKQHNGNDAMEWDGSAWQDRGFAGGNRPVIYDAVGNLVIAQAGANTPTGSIGYRYVDDAGRLVPSVETYADPARNIDEYTTKGDVTIGQSGIGGCVALVDGKRYLLEPGDTEFINVDRQGNQFAITIVKPVDGKTIILWCDRSEFAQCPQQSLSADPVPAPPAPAPSPVPEPKPMTNHLDVVQRERAKYAATIGDAECFAITNAVAADPGVSVDGWGLTKAPSGGHGYVVGGQNYRVDKLCHPSGFICDILGSSGSGAAVAAWNVNADPNGNAGNWAAPIAGFTITPSVPPPPVNPNPPSSPDLTTLIGLVAELHASVATLQVQMQQVLTTTVPPQPDLSQFAKRGAAVQVTGSVTLFGLKSNTATWTGTIL